MPSTHSRPIDLTRDARTIQNTFVGDKSAVSYESTLVRILLWLFDKREYNKFLDSDCLVRMERAHTSDRSKKKRKNLRNTIKALLAKVTSEDPDKKHGSPINLEGDNSITWPVIREYMSSLKKTATVDKKLAQKYKTGKGNRSSSSSAATATSTSAGVAATATPTSARVAATATPTPTEAATATPTAASASNRDIAERISNELVNVLISQSLASYEGVRSALMYLFKRAGVVPNQDLKAKMAQYIAGCKRTIQIEKQELAQKITEGKDPMSVETFEYIAKEMFVSDNAEESLFAHFFFLLDWNLMKRAENCAGCKINHIHWNGDALVFEFAKSKGDPDGKFTGPWHCYANPEKPYICVVLALAKYCLTYTDVLTNGAPLFEGSSQYDRYTGIFGGFVKKHAIRLRQLGVKPGDLGTHSVRKGVATMVAAGCTVSPPIVSLCLRVGWIMGGVKDKYLFYEAAGDHYVGRCATTLNRLKKEFAVSPPYFDFSEINDPVQREKKRESIEEYLYSRLGDLTDMERTRKMILMVFASMCFHHKYLNENLHSRNPLRTSTIWKDLTPEVRSHARIAYPWDKTLETPAFTGIPPHVSLLADIAELNKEVKSLKDQFSKDLNMIMDERGVGDNNFCTNRILEALERQTNKLMENHEERLQIRDAEFSENVRAPYVINEEEEEGDGSDEEAEEDSEAVKAAKLRKRDDKTKDLVAKRVQTAGLVNGRWTVLPRNYKFPNGMTMMHLIDSWLLSDGQQRIPPFVTLQASNLTNPQQRVRRKMKAVMMLVKRHGQKEGSWVGDNPTSWDHIKTRKLWDSIKNDFKASYYTIQRSGRSGLTTRGQGRQQVAKKRKNRDTTTCWSTVYSNCSAAGIFKGT